MLSGLSLLGLVRDDIGAELCVIGAWVTAVYPAQETRVRPGTQVRSLSDRKRSDKDCADEIDGIRDSHAVWPLSRHRLVRVKE